MCCDAHDPDGKYVKYKSHNRGSISSIHFDIEKEASIAEENSFSIGGLLMQTVRAPSDPVVRNADTEGNGIVMDDLTVTDDHDVDMDDGDADDE